MSVLLGTLALAVPDLAAATEPSALDVSEFNRAFGNMKSDLERQLTDKGEVYDSTIERGRTNLEKIIGYIRKSGADPAPFQKQLDDYLGALQERAVAAKKGLNEGKVPKDVPPITAMPGIDPIAAAAPTWCAPIYEQAGKGISWSSPLRMPETPAQVTQLAVQQVAFFACTVPDFPLGQAWTAAYRQQVSNLLGLSADENTALFTSAASRYRKNSWPRDTDEATKRCAALPGKTEGLLEERIGRDLERKALGCGTASGRIEMQFSDGAAPLWLIDLEQGPGSELAKLGLTQQLLTSRNVWETVVYAPNTSKEPTLLLENYGLAATIPIDEAAVWKELDALGLPETVRWDAGVHVHGALRALDLVGRWADQAAQANPNLAAVYLDGPKRGLAAYRAEAAKSAATMELVLALEDRIGPESGGMDGCAKQVYTQFDPWMTARLTADRALLAPEDLTFDDHLGSTLLYALITCGYNDDTAPILASLLEQTYAGKTNPQRGPLSAAYQGMLDAFNETAANPVPSAGGFSTARGAAKTTAIELQRIHRNPVVPPTLPRKINDLPLEGMTQRGVVAKLEPADGGFTRISFKTESYQSPIRDCVATNRISRIDDNGNFIPVYNCRTTGYETVKVTNDPVLMPAWIAETHGPGQLLVYVASEADEHRQRPSYGWPLAAYTNATGKTLASMLGVKRP